jgi:hypothetical protein
MTTGKSPYFKGEIPGIKRGKSPVNDFYLLAVLLIQLHSTHVARTRKSFRGANQIYIHNGIANNLLSLSELVSNLNLLRVQFF